MSSFDPRFLLFPLYTHPWLWGGAGPPWRGQCCRGCGGKRGGRAGKGDQAAPKREGHYGITRKNCHIKLLPHKFININYLREIGGNSYQQ